MHHIKFSLADVILTISSLIYGFIVFLGLNFISIGNLKDSSTKAILIAAGLFGLAYLIKLIKMRRKFFKTNITIEGFLFICFVILACYSFPFFSHFFDVLKNQNKISDGLKKSIDDTHSMFSSYDEHTKKCLQRYEDDMRSAIEAENTQPSLYEEFKFDPNRPASQQIPVKMGILKKVLEPPGFDTWKNQESESLKNFELKIEMGLIYFYVKV